MATLAPEDRVDYQRPEYEFIAPALQVLADVWVNLYKCRERYLPKAGREPDTAYQRRVNAATFNNKVAPMIESNAGLLTAFDVSGLPPSLEQVEHNVDGKGTSLKAFFRNANTMGLRDGLCYVLTTQPPPDQNRTRADDIANPRRPNWQLIDRRDVLNWRTLHVGGVEIIEQVTLRLFEDMAVGRYGVKTAPVFHHFQLVETGVAYEQWIYNEKGDLILRKPAKVIKTPRIPLVAYPYASTPFPVARYDDENIAECSTMPPFFKAAELNLKLFRNESTLDTIQYRVNAPTIYRVAAEPDLEKRAPIILGDNYVIELHRDTEGSGKDEVGVLELDGSGIERLQVSIETLKDDITAEGMSFVAGSRVERTATETYLGGAQASASLNGTARDMAAAIARLVADWCLFTGEEADPEIQLDHSLLEMPLDAQEIQALLAVRQASELSRQTFLELLRMGKQLPPDFDIEQEMQRLDEEFGRQTQRIALGNGFQNPLEMNSNGFDSSGQDPDLQVPSVSARG